jgi:hypothetical protein
MARKSSIVGRLAILGMFALVPACGGDAAHEPTFAGEEPLDVLDGPDGELELGKEDAARRTLPAFDKIWAAYPHGEASEVKKLIGGAVDAAWITNTCAIRVSRALNEAGFAIPRTVAGLNTVRGGDNKRYAYRVAELRRYMRTVLGRPDITSSNPDDFIGKKGLIVFEVRGWSDATGHFDLWDGTQPAHAEYFDRASSVQLWLAK